MKKVLHLFPLLSDWRLTIATVDACTIESLTQNEIKAKIAQESLLPAVSSLLKCLFVSDQPSVDVYSIVRVERMHCFL